MKSLKELENEKADIERQITARKKADAQHQKFVAEAKAAPAKRAAKIASIAAGFAKSKADDAKNSLLSAGFLMGSSNNTTGMSTWGQKATGKRIVIEAGKFTAYDKENQYLAKGLEVEHLTAFLNKK